jgi:hypothetical protein
MNKARKQMMKMQKKYGISKIQFLEEQWGLKEKAQIRQHLIQSAQ